jgi:ABC-type sugar transport system ATPase subunit
MEPDQMNPIISVKKLTKKFGGLTAVDEIDLDIFSGQITAIVGGNGAGKSTFIGMISGSYLPTSGSILYREKPLPPGDPLAIREMGIETIYQDLSLAELLNVPDNIFLGREKTKRKMGMNVLDKKFMYAEAEKVIDKLKIEIPFPGRPIRYLSGGQRQAVSIGRAIYWNAEVVIMDEPTAALGIQEKEQVMDVIRDLKSKGVTTIIISHEMQDVFDIADRIVVIYQGRCVAVKEKESTTIEEIASLIISGHSA